MSLVKLFHTISRLAHLNGFIRRTFYPKRNSNYPKLISYSRDTFNTQMKTSFSPYIHHIICSEYRQQNTAFYKFACGDGTGIWKYSW